MDRREFFKWIPFIPFVGVLAASPKEQIQEEDGHQTVVVDKSFKFVDKTGHEFLTIEPADPPPEPKPKYEHHNYGLGPFEIQSHTRNKILIKG